jgi:hypothetical protein
LRSSCPARSRDHAGLGAAGDRGDEHVVEADAEFGLLRSDLVGPTDEAQSSEPMVRRAGRDRVGLAPAVLDLADRLLPALLETDVESGSHETDVRAHQSAEQDVAGPVVGHVGPVDPTLLDEDALHAGLGGRRGHLARVIRLHATDGHQGVAAIGEGVGDQELELADLVAAEGQAGVDVVAFRPDGGSLEVLRQSIETVDR